MRKETLLLRSVLWGLVCCSLSAQYLMAQMISAPAAGAELKVVASGFDGTEGPATDDEGNVYFTSRADQAVMKWAWRDGKVSVYKEGMDQAIGLYYDASLGLVICELGKGRLLLDDLKGNTRVLVESTEDVKLHPNDVWVDSKGGMYFSSVQIFYLSPDHKTLTQVTSDIKNANGVTGTADGKTLYVGDMEEVFSYQIAEDGSLSNKGFFYKMDYSDGLRVDANNNVYVTGDIIYIVNPQGQLLGEIDVPERPKHMNFAGPDNKTLFITAPNAVYSLQMTVSGAVKP